MSERCDQAGLRVPLARAGVEEAWQPPGQAGGEDLLPFKRKKEVFRALQVL